MQCSSFYIEQTGHSFYKRFKVAISNLSSIKMKSSYTQYLLSYSHIYSNFNNNNVNILHVCKNR